MKENRLIPNSTQTPNIIFDSLLPRLLEGEARCLLYLVRRTFGFHREEDFVAFSQFEFGLKNRKGEQLDCGAGVSRPVISLSLRNLEKIGIIKTQKEIGKTTLYKINLNIDPDKIVKEINQLRKLTIDNKENLLSKGEEIVKEINPQKKEEKKTGKKDGSSVSQGDTLKGETNFPPLKDPPPMKDDINPLLDLFKSVNPAHDRLFAIVSQREALRRLLKSMGVEKLSWIISILEKTNQMPYSPIITTPYELEKKLGTLLAFIRREANKLINKRPSVANIK